MKINNFYAKEKKSVRRHTHVNCNTYPTMIEIPFMMHVQVMHKWTSLSGLCRPLTTRTDYQRVVMTGSGTNASIRTLLLQTKASES